MQIDNLSSKGRKILPLLSYEEGKLKAMNWMEEFASNKPEQTIKDFLEKITYVKENPSNELWNPPNHYAEFAIEFRKGVMDGLEMCRQVISDDEWLHKPFPSTSTAPSKISHYLRWSILFVDQRVDGFKFCVEESEDLNTIVHQIQLVKKEKNNLPPWHETFMETLIEGLKVMK